MLDLVSLLPLLYNGALLLALALIYDVLAIPANGPATWRQQVLLGLGASMIGVIIMLTPWQYAAGIVFDTRSVLLSISGLFFGGLPTLIAMAVTATLRIYQGGSGAVMGVSVIIATGLIGIGWRHWRRQALPSLSWSELFLFGLVVHFTMLALTILLPQAVAFVVFSTIAIPVLLVYPLATALLGRLLVKRLRHALAATALLASEERYRSYVDNAPYGVFVVNEQGRYLETNRAASQITGYSAAELQTMSISDTLTADAQAAGTQHFQQVLAEGQAFSEMTFQRKDGSTGWWSVAATRLTPSRFLGFIIDITATKAAEASTRQAETAYRDLYEYAPDMFLSVDAATSCVIQCNETVVSKIGYSKDELIGRPITDLYHPDSQPAFRQAFSEFHATGEAHNAEMKILCKDGSSLWVILNATAVRDDSGQILRSRAIWRDITERKAAEDNAQSALAALRQSEERFRHVAASISDIAYSCVKQADEDYVLGWMTGATERITGYSVADIIAMCCWGRLVIDEDRPLFEAQINGLAIGASGGCELRLRHRNGKIVWVAATAECVADSAGRWLYGALVDISARKQVEAALRQSEEKALALLNATDDAAFLVDPQGLVLALNLELAKRLGRNSSEILGRSIYDLLPPELGQRRREQVEQVLRTRQPVRFEEINGSAIVDHSFYPIFGPCGAVAQVAIFGRDVTSQRKAEERYQTLFREMLDGFALHEIICDVQGEPVDYRFLDVNPAFERLTGLEAANVLGKTVLEVLPATESYWIETYGRVALTRKPAYIQNYSQAIDRYFEVRVFAPAPGQFVTIFADVTVRRRAELALERRDALLEALSYAADRFLQANDWEAEMPVVLARLGEAALVSRVYLFQNETGAGGETLTSQRFEWCAPGVSAQIDNPALQHAAYHELGFARWEEILGQGGIIRGQVRDLPASERERLVAQGVQSLVEVPIHIDRRWWGFAGFEHCDREYIWSEVEIESLRAAGHVFGAAVKNQETLGQLHTQAGQMAQIMHSVAEGMLLIDGDGRVLMANPRAQSYLETLTGVADCRQISHLGDLPLATVLTSPLRAGQGHPVQWQQRTFDVLAHPVESGPTPGVWVLVVRDVTDELSVQQQLQRQERLAAIGQLAAGIAHDFNNLMSVIILYAQLTAKSPALGERERERLAIIEQQGNRGTAMIRQILDFSRRTVMEQQPIDLLALLRQQIELLARTLPEHIAIRLDYTPDEYVVRADPTRFEQVIMNLAVNARDAMPEGGDLTISLDRVSYHSEKETPLAGMKAGAWVRLKLTDSGAGIAADDQAHIFEPFFTTKAAGVGTGLGLAQVHGIVRQNGGHIQVYSEPGIGTTFVIYLPRVANEPPEPGPHVVAAPRGNGETVLLVEDNPLVLDMATEILQELGYVVIPANTPGVALAALAGHPGQIDLLITDVIMPEMSGKELAARIAEMRPALKRLFMSGYPADFIAHRGVLDADVNFLQKPFSLEGLAVKVRDALGVGSRVQRE